MARKSREPVKKEAILEKIIDQLTAELEHFHKAARAAHQEATDVQSRAENKYDTRGLEASYLARGQSRQVAETEQSIAEYRKLELRQFPTGTPIDLTALVELESRGERLFYFVGPRAGGTEVELDGMPILVITPQSPLGEQLLAKTEGSVVEITIAGTRDRYRIVSVS